MDIDLDDAGANNEANEANDVDDANVEEDYGE